MIDFTAKKFNVAYNVSADMVLRYSLEEIHEIMKEEVAQEMGSHALKKCTMKKHQLPREMTEELIYSCYIFSPKEMKELASYIQEIESDKSYLQFELNRRIHL